MAIVSIGAGLLLSITLFHMLPQAAGHPGQRLMPFVMLGFLFLFAIDMVGHDGTKEHGQKKMDGAVIGFVIHAFTEGVSLVAGFQVSPELGLSLLIALLFHKIPEGVTMASLLLAETNRRSTAFFGSVLLGLATLAGALIAVMAERYVSEKVTNPMIAFSAGVFLYVSASHLIPYIRQSGKIRSSLYFFGAVLAYMLFFVMFGPDMHHHHV